MVAKLKFKKAVVVPVMKTKLVEVRRLGTRESAEFEDELKALFEKGYKVVSRQHISGGGVRVQLCMVEDWTFEDFMEDLREHLDDSKDSY